MNNEYGSIVDLSVNNLSESARYHNFTHNEQAVDIIKQLYRDNDICLGELLTTIAINECNLEDILTIIAKIYKKIDDYDLILVRDNDDVAYLADGEKYDLHSNRELYNLIEIYESDDGIRLFQILESSFNEDILKVKMQDKIEADEYGYIKENGIEESSDTYFLTKFNEGFVEYSIVKNNLI